MTTFIEKCTKYNISVLISIDFIKIFGAVELWAVGYSTLHTQSHTKLKKTSMESMGRGVGIT